MIFFLAFCLSPDLPRIFFLVFADTQTIGCIVFLIRFLSEREQAL